MITDFGNQGIRAQLTPTLAYKTHRLNFLQSLKTVKIIWLVYFIIYMFKGNFRGSTFLIKKGPHPITGFQNKQKNNKIS